LKESVLISACEYQYSMAAQSSLHVSGMFTDSV